MHKHLNPSGLSVSGRQSELIELALTYGFRGLDIDMQGMTRQAEARGLEHALRFLRSAKMVKVGGFDVPIRWLSDEMTFHEELKKLNQVATTAAAAESIGARVTIPAVSDGRPYHEFFEFCRQRVATMADTLGRHGLRLGLNFVAPAHHRANSESPFISTPEALITLMKTAGVSNLSVVVDLWHWRVGGGTVEQIRELPNAQIFEVRVADLPANFDPATIAEQDRLLPASTGVVPLGEVLAVLKQANYDGPLVPLPNPRKVGARTRDLIVQHASDSLDATLEAHDLLKVATRLTMVPVGGEDDDLDLDISAIAGLDEE